MPLGIDATIRYGLDVPGTEALRESHLRATPRTTPATGRACRRRRSRTRARVDPGRRAPGGRRLPLLRPQAGQGAPLLHGRRVGVLRQGLRVRLRLLTRVRAATVTDGPDVRRWRRTSLRDGVITARRARRAARPSRRALALAGDAERRVRGAGARLGLRRARRRARATSRTRCAGSPRSASPARTSRSRTSAPSPSCATSSTGRPPARVSVNTLVFRDGRVLGSSTDGPRSSRPWRPRARGHSSSAAAARPTRSRRPSRTRARASAWRRGAIRTGRRRTRTRPSRQRDAARRRARWSSRGRARPWSTSPTAPTAPKPRWSRPRARAGCASSTASRCSCGRAPRRSERWTGVPAPLEVMRAAVRP